MITNRPILTVLFFLILTATFSTASNYLRVQDPQSWWKYGKGTIEEAVISVKPRGLYMECGLYLTLSGKGLGYSSADTLEIQYYFDLPEEAIVHDSWLWVEDEIIRGKLLDKWTAASIYEDIVKRRRDPSILFKNSKTQYELRIFPMAGNESRKVKITFLLPTNWNANSVSCTLPVNMLNVSRYPISTFNILSWVNGEWKNPKISEFPDNKFRPYDSEEFGNYLRADIPVESTQSSLNYTIDTPFDNGIYLNKYSGEHENYYQLALLPSQIAELGTASKKVAFLFDHQSSKTDIKANDLLLNVKEVLYSNFTSQDSFNLFFTNLDIERVSNHWVSADSITIETVFSNLEDDIISNYSSLPALLSNGIDFVQNNGNDGSLFLLSSSEQFGESSVANDLIDDLLAKMNPTLPIHVTDYANWSIGYNWIGGRYYRGNEYFYTNITRLTSANYKTTRTGQSLSELLLELSQSLGGFMTSFDLHTSLENGFCYGRFDFHPNQTIYLNKPILQVGKYNGELPFKIDIAGEFNNIPFSSKVTINETDIFNTDSLNEEIWSGKYIHSLEKEEQTNDIVGEIVAKSLEERVLSLYTAFLCLEPSRGGEVCYDCLDESSLITDLYESQDVNSDSLINVYPNPFNNQTKIQINLQKFNDLKNISIKIYNITGQVVKDFNSEINTSGKLNITWDGKNNLGSSVSSGTYFLIANNGQLKIVRKLLMIK
ncbi:MAG: T9SS C-terminal target domain-containing protein [Calditrichaeota bacterium]|nr:MAG: T9SS C-terminal target domain-containing protein [Calditrichota bacterium]MBL1207306.1 T9SS C-terminal target domain-containing protein [Calditrichota bacterium]NOG47138.1 T9SS type A sorting domain-containing protein [Calditrichota bacterium]